MRLDETAIGLPLNEAQRYFVSCWHNLVHEHSLDSHRIRTMNPRNILREFIQISEMGHANEADRELVRKEAETILSGDRILSRPPFDVPVESLLHALKKGGEKGTQSGLILSLCREILEEVNGNYVRMALEYLESHLADSISERNKEAIFNVTSSLLSTLVDTEVSLESLYQIYRNILVPRNSARYEFNRKYWLLKRLVLQEPTKHRVLFAIDGITSEVDFPPRMGEVAFFTQVDSWTLSNGPLQAYATTQSRRLFAEVTVTARDVRVAGTEAYRKIGSILDLTRFEYEREKVQLSTEFLVESTKVNGTKQARRLSIPKVVPNPVAGIGTQELSLFVASVNQLLSSARFQMEDTDRVLSAFRLYRQGADANSFETKLVNWWSAIEYLIRGKGQKQIGSVVEAGLTPLLCLIHGEKLLLDLKNTLVHARVQLSDPTTGSNLAYRDMGLRELRILLCRSEISSQVFDALQSDPFVSERAQKVLKILSSAQTYRDALTEHERRVRWHIQRLWRSRCDIVHNARLHLSGVLLCANLEAYLKVMLTSLLAGLRGIGTLGSPDEFFERQEFAYGRLRESLQAGSLDRLDVQLAQSTGP